MCFCVSCFPLSNFIEDCSSSISRYNNVQPKKKVPYPEQPVTSDEFTFSSQTRSYQSDLIFLYLVYMSVALTVLINSQVRFSDLVRVQPLTHVRMCFRLIAIINCTHLCARWYCTRVITLSGVKLLTQGPWVMLGHLKHEFDQRKKLHTPKENEASASFCCPCYHSA